MKLLRFCAALALACVFAAPASALSRYADGQPIILAQATTTTLAAPTATQNTITTTAPVTSETTISVGTLAGQILAWAAAVFAVPVGTLLSAWLWRLFKLAGVNATDALRARLQEFVVNGLNAGAKAAEGQLVGKGTVVVKNKIVADAVNYVQKHGADTLKQLGVDPYSNGAVDAIKARIETAIADPMTPTPAVLDPTTPAAAAPPAKK